MFSAEEGTTEFLSIPKAVKEVNSWLIKGKHAGVDMSRLENERFWIGGSDLSKFTLLCEEVIWEREDREESEEVVEAKDWLQCKECEYLIYSDEAKERCCRCREPYHSDCLFGYEKKRGREYDPSSLDRESKKYLLAARKWGMRKSSKTASVVLVDDKDEDEQKGEGDADRAQKDVEEFTCKNCKECRFCCSKISEEIIPSGTNLLPIEPFVICTKCNASAHGHCVFPPVPKLHSSVQWVCDDCRECNSCGRITYLNENTGLPSQLTDWALPSFDQCKQCFAGIDKGEYCPVCMRAWSVDWGGDMVQCDLCEFWVHMECDDLGSVNVSKLGGADVKYNCPICRDPTDVHRRRRVVDLLKTIDKVALFSEPVSAAFLPVYLKVIKQPMDLSKMAKKHYNNNLDFIKDFELIVENAKIFNMPNSPAYRLAEQFHKQGKLLVEKYLLIDRKGASKIEGLADADTSSDLTNLQPKRSASVNAEKNWKPNSLAGARKKVSYEHALEMIRKMAIVVSADPKNSISPYKRKLSIDRVLSPHPSMPLLLTPSPSSSVVVGGVAISALSDAELEREAMKIFGFSSNFFLKNNFGYSFPDSSPRNFPSYMRVKADFSNLLNDSSSAAPLSSQEIARDVRWCLYDACSICGSFGEPWNFVECQDCGDCFHWFCCGLVAPPSESLVSPSQNPLVGSKFFHQKQPGFKCASCVRCEYCNESFAEQIRSEEELFSCCLCGSQSHKKCMQGRPSFRLNFSPDSNVETVIEGTSVCHACVLSQAQNFFKAATCKGCNCLINPNVASCYFRAMPEGEGAAPAPISGRASPLVHCVACGDTWHTRCMPEFADVGSTDIQGVFLCAVCCSGILPVARKFVSTPPATAVDEVLANMGAALKQYRSKAYRDMQCQIFFETLRSVVSIAQTATQCASSPLVDDVMDIFSASSARSTDYPQKPPRSLSDEEKQWIEWGIRNKDNIVCVPSDAGRKKTALDAPNGNSVKVKRMEDEDLLLAKRLHSAFQLVKDIFQGQHNPPVEKDSSLDYPHAAFLPRLESAGADIGPTQISQTYFFSGSEGGARLLQTWLAKYGNAGGIGPGINVKKPAALQGLFGLPQDHSGGIPAWEHRTCVLCLKKGDSLVEGCLLPLSSSMKWVHAECAAWAFPTGISAPSLVEWKHARPVPMTVESLGNREKLHFHESQIIDLVQQCENIMCSVCELPGATIFCQSCHLGAGFHLPCAVSVNEYPNADSCRVLMDSRCRMLTCGKCLHRHPENEKFFTSSFIQQLQNVKASQSVLNDVWNQRHLNPSRVSASPSNGLSLDLGTVHREGPLSIVCPGVFGESSFLYDGSATIVPPGFVSVRLFWIMDLTLTKTDQDAGISITHSGKDLPLLKKRRRGAYLCKISQDGKVFSIQVIGGRLVAVGSSLSEVWNELKFMFGNLPSCLSAEWFFGLTCAYMKEFLDAAAIKSVKRQAGSRRERWLYQPQLRAFVTKALRLKSELKTISSIRRNLFSRVDAYKSKIDQLKPLGKSIDRSKSNVAHETLEPELVITEISGAIDDTNHNVDRSSKPSRSKSSSDSVSVPTDAGLRYKLRSGIVDIDLLTVSRSKIHNYGLFAKKTFNKGDMVVEYQGEILRQTLADEREKKSEREGDGNEGSCYMFKLDDDYVVDATVRGNCARFINHSCCPNCTCKMIEDDSRNKHIMIIAKRDILPGEEITYDYQFAVESEKLACLCGAPNCLGRLN